MGLRTRRHWASPAEEHDFINRLRDVLGLDPLYDKKATKARERTAAAPTHGGNHALYGWLDAGCYRAGPAGRWCSGAFAAREE